MSIVADAKAQMQKLSADGPHEKAFREQAWSDFVRSHLLQPDGSVRESVWRREGLAPVLKGKWRFMEQSEFQPTSEAMRLIENHKDDFDVVVLVNGRLLPHLSVNAARPLSLKEALPSEFGGAFASLAAALAQPGLRLEIPANLKRGRPILIVHEQSGDGDFASALHEIHVGEGASLAVAELFLGRGGQSSFRAELTKVSLGGDSALDWLRVDRDGVTRAHYSEVRVECAGSSRLNVCQVAAGSGWSRAGIGVELKAKEAEADLCGLSFGRLNQQMEQRWSVEHLAPHTRSSQLHKGVYKDRSRGALFGKIMIAEDAQKVCSSQLSQNILLSLEAEAVTHPELEVFADDVKANHGASVGRIDEDKIFYLQSRGLGRAESQGLLAHAFVADVLMKIPRAELRRLARGMILEFLPEFISEMEA